MADENELTVEEMKSLVSLATLLPALLEKIAAINRDVTDLRNRFADLGVKFNTNTKAILEYKQEVEQLMEAQPNLKPIEEELKVIKASLLRIDATFNGAPLAVPQAETPVEKPKKAKKEKPADPDEERVQEIVKDILDGHRGRKRRSLTLIDVKVGFRVEDSIAEKVLNHFENKKLYNRETHILTFPKR